MRIRSRYGIILIFLVAIIAASCGSTRSPYKRKKPRKCDCSRWSYHEMKNTVSPEEFYAVDKGT